MKLFISYRRKSWPFIQLLAEKLGEQIKGDIFIDYTSIDETDFEQSILRHLRESDIVLVVVTDLTFSQERIQNDDDWVRREIALALELKKPIVLIRVDNLLPPPPSQLPENIRDITRMQGIAFYPEYFDAAVQSLTKFINTVLSSNPRSKGKSSSSETNQDFNSQVTVSRSPETSLDNEPIVLNTRRQSNTSRRERLTPPKKLQPIQPSSEVTKRKLFACKKTLEVIRKTLLYEMDLRELTRVNIDVLESDLRKIIGELESLRSNPDINMFVDTVDGIQINIRDAIRNLSLASDFLTMPRTLRNREQMYKKLEEVPYILANAIAFFRI